MLAPSQLNKPFLIFFMLAIFWHSIALSQNLYRGLMDDRTRGDIHGLYEINEEAIKFLQKENTQNETHWESLEPNLKILVPRCSIPLRAAWTPRDRGLSNKSVSVICEKSILENMKKWDVNISVIDASLEKPFIIYETVDSLLKQENTKKKKKLKIEWSSQNLSVPKCEVPLTAEWSKISKTPFPNVTVTCSKANRKNDERKQWRVEVKTSAK
jgi:hypothetical protein